LPSSTGRRASSAHNRGQQFGNGQCFELGLGFDQHTTMGAHRQRGENDILGAGRARIDTTTISAGCP